MKRELCYPRYRAFSRAGQRGRRTLLIVFAAGFLITLIVNLAVGGPAFCLVVLLSECVFWIAFAYRPLVENSVVTKVTDVAIATCVLLMIVNWVTGGTWSDAVVGWIVFALMILVGCAFLLGLHTRKVDMMPLFWMILGSIAVEASVLLGLIEFTWPALIACFIAVFFTVLGIIFYREALFSELKKRFHTR